jgi:hypothetical protein
MAGRTIFSARSTQDEWAFHSGGRDELQFNVGLDEFPDGSPALRAGVAFSLARSQTLPDWRVLAPLIGRFNEFLRDWPDAFSDLGMWHWEKEQRGRDRSPGPIEAGLVGADLFIFLGVRQPLDSVDVHECLRTFDRLLPLYRFVEEGRPLLPDQTDAPRAEDAVTTTQPTGSMDLGSGVETKTTGWIKATYAERTLDVFLRHNEMQNRLKDRLRERGADFVSLEARIGQRSVDVVAKVGEELWFFEVKTASSVRQCLREAIGQLLEYALWPGAVLPTKLVVVGEPLSTPESVAYLEALNTSFPIPIEYEQLALH